MKDEKPQPECLTLQVPVVAMDFMAAGEGASRIKQTLKKIGFSPQAIRRAAICAYEAEMNIVIHSQGGTLTAKFLPEKVELLAEDKGPGISDISQAMQEGYTTATHKVREMGFGAGMGLANIKKCAEELDIQSKIGEGTKVRIVVYNDGQLTVDSYQLEKK